MISVMTFSEYKQENKEREEYLLGMQSSYNPNSNWRQDVEDSMMYEYRLYLAKLLNLNW